MGSFDIRADIAEVPQEDDTVPFTFEIKLARQLREMRAAAFPDEEEIARAEAKLADATYVAHVVSVPSRRREDIYIEALDKFPSKPTMFGKDEKAEFQRGLYIRIAICAAGVVRLVRPNGDVQEDELFEAIKYIHDEAPDQVYEAIEAKVNELNRIEDEQQQLHKTADF